MQDYQHEFLDFALATGVLKFGEFTLKSGRVSPYFFNSGLFNTGASLARLGRYYAAALVHSGVEYDMLYGPAYKGIPLVATVSIALADHHGRDVPYAFNRKEVKRHGEGGLIVGAPLAGRVLIVDDVISAGISVGEAVAIIKDAGAQSAGVLIALDRQERGQGELSAVQEVQNNYGIPVVSIVTLETLLGYVEQRAAARPHLDAIQSYLTRYGV